MIDIGVGIAIAGVAIAAAPVAITVSNVCASSLIDGMKLRRIFSAIKT